MRIMPNRIRGALLILACLALVLPGSGQYREYYVFGKVVDTQKKPLEGVEIDLRDAHSGRIYSLTTKKDGAFKFAGLPHGLYKVSFKKDGFAEKDVDWNFEKPQDVMLKVEVPAVILAPREQVEEAQRLKEADADVKAAAEKIRIGDYEKAVADLKAILEKNPKNANALYLLGMAYLKQKKWPDAVAPFLQVAESSPGFAAVHYQLGVCYQQQKEPEKALESYQRAMTLDPANPDTPYNSGLIMFGLNRIDEALAFFERTLSLKPDDPASLEMAGRCLINKARFDQALDFLERAKAGYAADPERVKFLDDLIAKVKEQIKK